MGDYVKYKDPNQPVAVRVEDLLSRMTLEEKIGQMVQIDRTVATADIMRNYYIGNLYIHKQLGSRKGLHSLVKERTSLLRGK